MCCDEGTYTGTHSSVKLYICKYYLVLDLLLFKNGLHVCEISNTVKHTPSTRVKINHIHIRVFIDFYLRITYKLSLCSNLFQTK